jgi:hypothetical protein
MSPLSFTRHGCLLSPSPDMTGPGPYYTCLVDMRQVAGFGFDYALYFSTDHDDGMGGIWLYVGNGSPTDPTGWQSYDEAVAAGCFDHIVDHPPANPIFVDTVQGTGHTETPHVNVVDGMLYMTYHKNGIENTQRTLLATSSDGVCFSRIHGDEDSVILRYATGERPGNGHTGYFRWAYNPFPGIAQKFVGYSLHGGGDDYHSAIWASDDALQWQVLDVLTPIEGHAMPDEDMILIWHDIDPGSITSIGNGEYVALCGGGTRASGGVARIVELYEVFLADDGRTLTRACHRILGVAPGGDETEELTSPTSLVVDGTHHLIYVGASRGGTVNTVMGASGGLDHKPPTGSRLGAAEQTRHLLSGS